MTFPPSLVRCRVYAECFAAGGLTFLVQQYVFVVKRYAAINVLLMLVIRSAR